MRAEVGGSLILVDSSLTPEHANLTRRPKVSVCVATYNGAQFVLEQLRSIIPQLERCDEIIVVDDSSTDSTVDTLTQVQDNRLRIIRNAVNEGVVKTFEKALKAATGEILFLCDQDDVWRAEKVARVLHEFADPAVLLVITNATVIDIDGRPARSIPSCQLKRVPKLAFTMLTNRFQGSLMAFRRDVLRACLPIPDGIAMHDWWIGAVVSTLGKAVVVRETLMYYRRHPGSVTTGRKGLLTMIRHRWNLWSNLTWRLIKLRIRG